MDVAKAAVKMYFPHYRILQRMYLCIFTKNNGTKALSYTRLIFKMSVESLRRSSHVDTHCACCLHWLGESTTSRIQCESTTKSFVKFSQRFRSQETKVLHYVFQWFVLDTFKVGYTVSFSFIGWFQQLLFLLQHFKVHKKIV